MSQSSPLSLTPLFATPAKDRHIPLMLLSAAPTEDRRISLMLLSAAPAGERKGPIAKQWEGEVVPDKTTMHPVKSRKSDPEQ